MSPLTEAFLRCMLWIMKSLLCIAYASAIVSASLIFSGCSPAGSEPAPDSLAFSIQDPAAWKIFDRSAADLASHTGAQAVTSIRGTTVHSGPRPDDSESCADTTVVYFKDPTEVVSVDIALYLPIPAGCYDDPALTLAHEMIHAARAWAELSLGDPDADHSASGVFRAVAGDPRFDESTLTKFCEAVLCTQFDTE